MILDVGRVCLKIAGREAGKYCIVIGKEKNIGSSKKEFAQEEHAALISKEAANINGFVLVSGPKTITGIKRRKCNIVHLEPTEHKFELTGTEDENLEQEWKKSGLIEKLGIVLQKKRTKEKIVKERPRKVMRNKAGKEERR